MRYRRLDANLDMTFGNGKANFLVNSPACVAQAVLTALKLTQGEWFLDVTAGVPYPTEVLGTNTTTTRDQAIRNAILGVEGVKVIVNYGSQFNPVTRTFTVGPCEVSTIYGPAIIPPVTL